MDVIDKQPTITDITNQINNLKANISKYKALITRYPPIGRAPNVPLKRQPQVSRRIRYPPAGMEANINELNDIISANTDSINDLIKSTLLTQKKNNYDAMDTQLPILLAKMSELQSEYAILSKIYQNLDGVDAANEYAEFKINTNFYTYVFYVFLTIFVSVSLFYIHRNPEVKNLDRFMLGLATFILVYYLYEYLTTKSEVKRWLMALKSSRGILQKGGAKFLSGKNQ
jgi:hypothetical protein